MQTMSCISQYFGRQYWIIESLLHVWQLLAEIWQEAEIKSFRIWGSFGYPLLALVSSIFGRSEVCFALAGRPSLRIAMREMRKLHTGRWKLLYCTRGVRKSRFELLWIVHFAIRRISREFDFPICSGDTLFLRDAFFAYCIRDYRSSRFIFSFWWGDEEFMKFLRKWMRAG